MDIKDCKVGMHIRISLDISKTQKSFSLDSPMLDMRGKVYKIEKIFVSGVMIEGYTWDPSDLIELEDEKEKSEMIFLFNPETL